MFSFLSSVRQVFSDRSLPHRERLLRPPAPRSDSQAHLSHTSLSPTSQVSIEVFQSLSNSAALSTSDFINTDDNTPGNKETKTTNGDTNNGNDLDNINHNNGKDQTITNYNNNSDINGTTTESNGTKPELETERSGDVETNAQPDPPSSYDLKESYRCKGLSVPTPSSIPLPSHNDTCNNNTNNIETIENADAANIENSKTETIETIGDEPTTTNPPKSRRLLQESVGDVENEIILDGGTDYIGEKDLNELESDKKEKLAKRVELNIPTSDEILEDERDEKESKTMRKKLMKKVSVLQLTTHGSAFSTRQGAHDNFVIKLGKADFRVERGEQHEYKAVVVDCSDYQVTVIPFIMALASALHTCGVPAHRMERALTLLSNCFGIESTFFYTPTGLFCSFNHPKPIFAKNQHNNMQLIRLPMVDWDMERLCFLEELCDDVIGSRVHISEGVSAIRDIMSLPLRYTVVFEILASVVLSLGFAVLFGFSWSESRASGLAGIWPGLMLSVARKYASFHQVNSVVSGLGAGIIVSLFSIFVTPVHNLLAAVAALMFHLPSLSITMAISELVTGNIVAGTSRFTGAWCAILQVAFGSWSGVTIVGVFSHTKTPLPASPEGWYWILFATFLASIGYSILCRVPPKLMWVVFVSGTLGTAGAEVGGLLNPSFGAFLGAFLICIFANLYARKVKRGLALIPIWSGMLLLVPGYVGIKGLISVSDLQLSYGTTQLVVMLQNATALALGLFSANVLAHPYKAL